MKNHFEPTQPVTVLLRGALKQYGHGQEAVQIQAGASIYEIAAGLGIPGSRTFSTLVNGQVTDLSYQTQPGDVLQLIPVIAGGSQ